MEPPIARRFYKLRVLGSLSRQRSRVRAPSSPPYIPKDLRNIWDLSDNQIWVRYGCNKRLIERFEGVIHHPSHPIRYHLPYNLALIYPLTERPATFELPMGYEERLHSFLESHIGPPWIDSYSLAVTFPIPATPVVHRPQDVKLKLHPRAPHQRGTSSNAITSQASVHTKACTSG